MRHGFHGGTRCSWSQLWQRHAECFGVYLGKFHSSRVPDYAAIWLAITAIPDELRVPNPEVFFAVVRTHGEDGDGGAKVATVCGVLQMTLHGVIHILGSLGVTGIKHLNTQCGIVAKETLDISLGSRLPIDVVWNTICCRNLWYHCAIILLHHMTTHYRVYIG